jgi:HEAT repeat protein
MKRRKKKTRRTRPMEKPGGKDVISRILTNNESPSNAELAYFSELDDEELELFHKAWNESTEARRREIISHLVQLCQTNFRLDFNTVFTFCLQDKDPEIRVQAINGLAEDENQHHIAPLVKLMKTDSSTEVRAVATIALGRFAMLAELGELSERNAHQVYATLLGIADSEAESIELKSLALEAISPLNLPGINELIENAYKSNDNKLKTSAIRAMGRNCNPGWLDILEDEIGNNDAGIRYEVARACGEIAVDEAIPCLLTLMNDENFWVQEAVVHALKSIGSEKARQELVNLTKNPQPKIRRAAREAIKELDWENDILFMDY